MDRLYARYYMHIIKIEGRYKMQFLEFDWDNYSEDDMIIVYGTEGFGRMVYYCLKQKHVKPAYYVNKNGKGRFLGIPVIDIDVLKQVYHDKHPIILLATGAASKAVIWNLKMAGIETVYSIFNLLEEIKNMSAILDSVYQGRNNFFYQQDSFINQDKLIMHRLDVMVTERCSLRCEKCSNLMQYYHNPQNLDIQEIKKSLDTLLEAVDTLYELRFLGGEPFMNPDFYELIDLYKEHPKVKKFAIYTNATIFPEEHQRERLKSPKLIMKISDYDELSTKFEDWIQWCEDNGIEYVVMKFSVWQDCGTLRKHGYSTKELRYIYETCQCNNIPTLIEGRIFNCPYAANAVNLGALYKEEAEQDMLDLSDSENLRERIKEFLFERKYLMSCDYCEGRNDFRKSVKPHIQAKAPLEYVVQEDQNEETAECDSSGL